MTRLTVLFIASVLGLGLVRSIQAAQQPIEDAATAHATIQMLRTALADVTAERDTAAQQRDTISAERASWVERMRGCVSQGEMARVLKMVAASR